jgi:hypothetical protein
MPGALSLAWFVGIATRKQLSARRLGLRLYFDAERYKLQDAGVDLEPSWPAAVHGIERESGNGQDNNAGDGQAQHDGTLQLATVRLLSPLRRHRKEHSTALARPASGPVIGQQAARLTLLSGATPELTGGLSMWNATSTMQLPTQSRDPSAS